MIESEARSPTATARGGRTGQARRAAARSTSHSRSVDSLNTDSGGNLTDIFIFQSSGGGVRGRLGPPKKNRGGINLRNVGFDEDDDGDMSSQGSSRGGYQSGRARPAGRGMFKPRGGRGGRGRGGISGAQMALRRAVAPPTAGWHKVT